MITDRQLIRIVLFGQRSNYLKSWNWFTKMWGIHWINDSDPREFFMYLNLTFENESKIYVKSLQTEASSIFSENSRLSAYWVSSTDCFLDIMHIFQRHKLITDHTNILTTIFLVVFLSIGFDLHTFQFKTEIIAWIYYGEAHWIIRFRLSFAISSNNIPDNSWNWNGSSKVFWYIIGLVSSNSYSRHRKASSPRPSGISSNTAFGSKKF